jgi:uncharacterized protein YegL
MPKLLDTSDMQTGTIPGLRGYGFSAVRADRLGASEYTLVTLACDVSGSVIPFRDLLVDSIKKAVGACRKSPRAANIMVRTVTFNQGVTEIHGFKPLADIDDAEYDAIRAGGGTALFDASASAIGATTAYGKILADQDYAVNGILFVITDGEDFDSTYTAATVKEKADEAVTGEVLDSFLSVLVGVNAARCSAYLERFRDQAAIAQYVDAGDATPGNLAKLASFVSRSVSSQAGSVGTGQSATVTF